MVSPNQQGRLSRNLRNRFSIKRNTYDTVYTAFCFFLLSLMILPSIARHIDESNDDEVSILQSLELDPHVPGF